MSNNALDLLSAKQMLISFVPTTSSQCACDWNRLGLLWVLSSLVALLHFLDRHLLHFLDHQNQRLVQESVAQWLVHGSVAQWLVHEIMASVILEPPACKGLGAFPQSQ